MKKLFVVFFCLFFFLPYANAAHYFNRNAQQSGYHTDRVFSLVYIKAEREKGTELLGSETLSEKEDRFWIKFKFTENVENVEIEIKALDGTNDNDRREYTIKYSSIPKDRLKEIYCGNLPTHVDNLLITVKYYQNELYFELTIYVYSFGEPDKDSGTFKTDSDGIPDQYKDSDGNGAWDSNKGFGKVGSPLLKFVSGPYNFLKWLTDIDTLIALALGFITLKIGFICLIYTRSFGFIILIFVGGLLIAGTIIEGFTSIM